MERRRTEVQAANAALGRICSVEDCDRGVYEGVLCGYHLQVERWNRRAAAGRICRIDGCERGIHARALCRGHYSAEYQRERRARAAAARAGVVPDPGAGPP